LRKGLPIGAITWGIGSIGRASISTLAKDFRALLENDPQWKIDLAKYRIEDVAQKFTHFFLGKYRTEFQDWEVKPDIGFIVVGYSAGSSMSEEYLIRIDKGECIGPVLLRKPYEAGITWDGQPEAILRLVKGYSERLPTVLAQSGIPEKKIAEIIAHMDAALLSPMVVDPMPIQDAIHLAEFLVNTTIQFSRFNPGATTVDGPVEIAAITKHEGFKWIKRKYYYRRDLNPNERLENDAR
jgi:hypothetical protein